MDFQKVRTIREPARPLHKSIEGRSWRQYRNPIFVKENQAVVHVHFVPTSTISTTPQNHPHGLAVTTGARVNIYSNKTHRITKTIARFKDTAYSAEIRSDGRLAIAGDASGLVQIFDLTSRAILRTLNAHRLSTRVTKFSPWVGTGSLALTASDDKTIKIWDISTGEVVNDFCGHKDYIRAATFSVGSPSTIISGGYDGIVKVWDTRVPDKHGEGEDSSVMSMKHGLPIESVICFPSGSSIVSAGGPLLRQWDLISGGRCLRALSNHQKTVTTLAFDPGCKRLLSGSLDQMVKVWDVSTWKVVHGMRYTGPVLDVAMSPDGTHIAAGMANGLLNIRYKSKKAPMSSLEEIASFGSTNAKPNKSNPFQIINASKQDDAPRPGSAAYFQRTKTLSAVKAQQTSSQSHGNSIIIASGAPSTAEKNRKRRLRPYDKLLRSFRHAEALDAVLPDTSISADPTRASKGVSSSIPSRTVASVLLELIHRGALKRALEGRDEHSLEPILRWSLDQICRNRFDRLITIVTTIIIDLYGGLIGKSQLCYRLLEALNRKIISELDLADNLKSLQGKIEMIAATN